MDLRNRAIAVLVGTGVLLLGLILQQIAVLPAFLVDPAVAFDPEEATRLGVMLLLPLNFLGLGAAGVIYLYLTGRGWKWLDLRRPGRWDVVWMIGGTVLTIVLLILVGLVAQALEAEPPEQSLMLLIREDMVLLLFMIATVWLLNAPIEEFLFRNIIQKRLYSAFSGVMAVIIASLLFAVVHVFTFALAGVAMMDVLFPILGIFSGSIVMGFAYLRTKNLFVPIVIHAGFNSIQLIILLIALVYDLEDPAAATLLFTLL